MLRFTPMPLSVPVHHAVLIQLSSIDWRWCCVASELPCFQHACRSEHIFKFWFESDVHVSMHNCMHDRLFHHVFCQHWLCTMYSCVACFVKTLLLCTKLLSKPPLFSAPLPCPHPVPPFPPNMAHPPLLTRAGGCMPVGRHPNSS